jgi:hypothetical protein
VLPDSSPPHPHDAPDLPGDSGAPHRGDGGDAEPPRGWDEPDDPAHPGHDSEPGGDGDGGNHGDNRVPPSKPETGGESPITSPSVPSSSPTWDPARADHIFRDADGHVNPPLSSQQYYIQQWQQIASDSAFHRPDAVAAGIITQDAANTGVTAFSQIRPEGQFWVLFRDGKIVNAG